MDTVKELLLDEPTRMVQEFLPFGVEGVYVIPKEFALYVVIGIYAVSILLAFGLTSGSASGPSRVSRRRRDNLLLVGPHGGGKTTLFNYFMNGKGGETVTSLKENSDLLTIADAGNKKVKVIDIPGYTGPTRIIEEYLSNAKLLLIMVDSQSHDSISNSAEMLYEILNIRQVYEELVPVVVVCNMQDAQFVKNADKVKEEIASDMQKMKQTKLANMEDRSEGLGYIETNRKEFSFAQIVSPIHFVETSIKKGELGDLPKHLAQYL